MGWIRRGVYDACAWHARASGIPGSGGRRALVLGYMRFLGSQDRDYEE
jgi:hypothetical protein